MQRIAVLGLGRSGTTFLTEFLGKCGVYLDEVNWAYEHELGRLVNDTLLAQQFGARPGLPYGRLPKGELRIRDLDYWRSMASFYIKYMDARAQLNGGAMAWAFKDPRMTVLHTIWIEHFEVIIGMYRHPQEVVDSYIGQKWVTGLWKKRIAMDYWKTFNRALLDIYRQHREKKTVFVLQYNVNVERQTRWVCKQLDVPITQEAQSLFNNELKHYTRSESPRDSETKELYETLQAINVGNV